MSAATFDELVGQSITETMSKILGTDTWKAINFFFDTKQVASKPEAFETLLDRMFGHTSKVLQREIGQAILDRLGAPQQTSSTLDFKQILRLARSSFLRVSLSGSAKS